MGITRMGAMNPRTLLILTACLLLPARWGVAQEPGIEKAGDVAQIALPAAAFLGTIIAHDSEGTSQFLKSFLANMASTAALKLSIDRRRPDGSNDASFPSGHTSAAFQGAAFIHFRYGLGKALPAYALATFVGYSRVNAEKHYVSDVLAGAALGTLSAFLFTERFERLDLTAGMEARRLFLSVRLDRSRPW